MNKYLNYWGLIFVIVILIPNIVFAITCKDGFENRYKNEMILYESPYIYQLSHLCYLLKAVL